jgi:cellulose synthase (UDP-forming)
MTAELWLPWLLLLWPLWLSRRPEARCPIWMRRSLLLLLTALTARYLHWRVTASLTLDTPLTAGLSLLLLAAEAWLLVCGLLPLLLAWRRFDDGRADADRAGHLWRNSGWRPSVDVLIPTCGEPLPVLERCLLGCTNLHYPDRTIWVLDDANRPEVAALAARWGCRYLARPQRHHAKAGNLNHGLAQAQAELVAVFDADFVPQQHFLDRTIGLLLDPAVALVQTPQCFFNADPVLRNLELERWLLPDEESFYRWIEPVRSAWGAVVCTGTSFVARRAALDSVGGFVEAAVSEDFVTGIALAARGWQLRYLGEKLSAGLAAETMLDFVRQRQRWAVGTLQALRLAQGPLRVRGLGWGQRLAYLEGALHWINTVPRLVLLLMPLAIGAVGVIPIRFTAADLVSLLLPLWLALLLGVGWLNRSSRHALLAELPGWALAIPLSATVLQALWGRVLPFRITPKHQVLERGGIDPLLGRPLLALLLLNGVNLAAIGLALGSGGANAQLGLGLLWAALNLLGLLVALRVCWDRPSPDPTPWLGLSLPATLQGPGGQQCQGQLTALSETGADLLLTGPGPGPVGSGWQLLLELDADANKALPPLTLAPFPPSAAAGGRLSVGWDLQASAAVVELRRWLFSRPGAWPDRLAPPEWQALLALLSQLARRPQPPEAGRRSLVPQQHPPRPGPGGSGGR